MRPLLVAELVLIPYDLTDPVAYHVIPAKAGIHAIRFEKNRDQSVIPFM